MCSRCSNSERNSKELGGYCMSEFFGRAEIHFKTIFLEYRISGELGGSGSLKAMV